MKSVRSGVTLGVGGAEVGRVMLPVEGLPVGPVGVVGVGVEAGDGRSAGMPDWQPASNADRRAIATTRVGLWNVTRVLLPVTVVGMHAGQRSESRLRDVARAGARLLRHPA